MSVYAWSTTAADNDDADANINWLEGQSPATVNNSARAMMVAIAADLENRSGALTTGGTGSAYTLTTNDTIVALSTSVMFMVKFHTVSTLTTATLNVDSLGAKTMKTWNGQTFPCAEYIPANAYCIVKYDGSNFRVFPPYEYASYTPVLSAATPGDLSLSGESALGGYTRVGNRVDVWFDYTFSPTFTTATGDMHIGGLPYTSAAAGKCGGGVISYTEGGITWPTGKTSINLSVIDNVTYMKIVAHKTAATSTYVQIDSGMASGGTYTVAGQVTYFI